MEALESLKVWMDPVARMGPEAMAVDEWLLETVKEPLLRVYGWDGAWASVGYFGKIEEGRRLLGGVKWVRRWTGGGMVDHRADWTYTLVVPRGERWAGVRGAASYRWIHMALISALEGEGVVARLSDGGGETGGALCFENPVNHDVIGVGGQKLAGAGQRRTHYGFLQQGSAAIACGAERSRERAGRMAQALAERWEWCEMGVDDEVIQQKTTARYGDERWLEKR